MSHDVIGNISFNQQVVDAMCSDGAVERVMDSTVSYVGAIHGATKMKVDGIPPQTECLASITHFSVFNSGGGKEGGREGGRETGREGDREGGREGERKGRRKKEGRGGGWRGERKEGGEEGERREEGRERGAEERRKKEEME